MKETNKLPVFESPDVAELEQLRKKLSELQGELHILKTNTSRDLVTFERELKSLYAARHALRLEMSKFPRYTRYEEREYRSIHNAVLRRRVADYSKWTPEMLDVKNREGALTEEIESKMNTLIAVTLIDDPDVNDSQLNCGVNGEMVGLFYSSDSMLTVSGTSDSKESKRVQLIPYKFYEALMRSYKVKFKQRVDERTGNEVNIPYSVRPVLEAFLPDDDLVRRHFDLMRKKQDSFIEE